MGQDQLVAVMTVAMGSYCLLCLHTLDGDYFNCGKVSGWAPANTSKASLLQYSALSGRAVWGTSVSPGALHGAEKPFCSTRPAWCLQQNQTRCFWERSNDKRQREDTTVNSQRVASIQGKFPHRALLLAYALLCWQKAFSNVLQD